MKVVFKNGNTWESKKFTLNGRKLSKISKFVVQKGNYGLSVVDNKIVEVDSEEDCNLVSSLCDNGLHKPVIDFDFPCQLVESSTTGHYHLYIDREMGWGEYDQLLEALVRVGLVEQGFYDTAQKFRQTFVRPPWVKKDVDSEKVGE